VARIVEALPAGALPQPEAPVPLFTRRLRAGIGVAEDPGNGESFGMHRCRLAADAIVAAWWQGRADPEARFEAVEARFRLYGLTLDRPYLAPGSVDFFDAAIPAAVAA